MTKELTAWKKKYQIRNYNTGSLEGHKTYININWKRGMRKDFRDIRFTDKKGNLLPHYLLMYSEFSWAQFWVWLPPCTANPVLYCYFGNGAVKSASSFSGIGGLVADYFESGAIDYDTWSVKQRPPYTTAGIKTDYKYNSYSLGLDLVKPDVVLSDYNAGNALLKIPLSSIPVGSRVFIFMLARRSTTTAADFLGFGLGGSNTSSGLYDLPKDSTWHDYLIKVYRAGENTWEFYFFKDGVAGTSITNFSWTFETNFLFGLQTWKIEGSANDHAWLDNVLAYLEPSGGWFSGYPAGLSWGRRCAIPFRKRPYSQSITAGTSASLAAALTGYQDSLNINGGGLSLSKPSFAFGLPDEITETTGLNLHVPDPTIVDFTGLADFSLISATIKKSINDSYWSFSGAFAGELVPGQGSRIKFNAKDPEGESHLIFYGKSTPNRPSFGYLGSSVQMDGADDAQGLAIQKIPWDARVIKLDGNFIGWDLWISYLANLTENNLIARVINRPSLGSTEIKIDPKSSRLDAIKQICNYTGYLFISKVVNTGTPETPIWKTGLYFLDPADIDNKIGGLDLPDPLILTAPDASLLDAPSLEPDLENNYNTVTIYGTLSSDGLFYVLSACTPEVAAKTETVREYRFEDNKISEKGTSFQNEAVKWLIYFLTRQASVKMKFIDRFDLELYQRLRFGDGFKAALRGLTDRPAFTFVRVFDPRDPVNYQDIDISGVPRPSWLRITDISYGCAQLSNTVDVTAKTDWIYSNSDPYIDPAFSQFVGSGYFKPEISDQTSTTQSLIDNSLSKQSIAQKGTILSISADGKTAQVLTDDGKTVSAAVVSTATVGANILIVPGSSGYYIS